MKKTVKVLLLFSVIFYIGFSALYAQKLKVLKTDNLNLVYYHNAHTYVVPHLARCFENSLGFYKNLFDYTPTEKVTIFLKDFSDYGNGGATALPVNLVLVSISPFLYTYEVINGNERMNWLMNHELVHVIAMDRASDDDNYFRSAFLGKVNSDEENPVSMLYSYLTSPRTYAPRWYHEGIAVFLETWMSGGLGRALGFYDEMVFRTKIHDNSYLYHAVGLESEGTTTDFQIGAISYLYGTRFFTYLAKNYGPEKLIEWVSRTNRSKRYFVSQFKNVFSTSLDDEWTQWLSFEKDWQQANLATIRKNPTTSYRPIIQEALGSVSPMVYEPKLERIYAAVQYPGHVSHIAAIDIHSGKIDKICDVTGAALYSVCSLTYDASSSRIYYTTNNNSYRDLNVVDIQTKKSERLIRDLRAGDLTYCESNKSLWGVRHHNGISTLIKIDPPYNDWTAIYAFPYGKDFYDIDISPDGSLITGALTDIAGKHKLISFQAEELLESNYSYDVLFDFDISSPASFKFSEDGTYLYGSSYYTGVSNIYRYSFKKSEMDILSNCETGFFRPLPVSEDSLIVMRYTGKGFVPVWIANEPVTGGVSAIKLLGQEVVKHHPIVRSWMPESVKSINIDSLTVFSGEYSAWKNTKLNSAYPVIEGYKDYVALGYRFNIQNELQFNKLNITVSYTPSINLPSDERLHLGLAYQFWNWGINAQYNGADFYDLFGPTKTSRKGYSLGLEYNKNLLYDKPKTLDFNFSIAGYGGLKRLPDYQNVAATYDKLLSANMSFDYDYRGASLGAVDYEKGVKWQLSASSNYVNLKMYPRINFNFDYGVPLLIKHSSVWFRTSAGYSFGDKDNPFVNFFFGGFGNNWIDRLSIQRYRTYYSFPGVDLNEFGGKSYGKLMLEWNLPPIRFRNFGSTSIYLRWARIALFNSAIMTNFNSQKAADIHPQFGTKRALLNIGGQLDFRIVLFSYFSSTLSIGYAAAFEEDQNPSKEFMISLKIL